MRHSTPNVRNWKNHYSIPTQVERQDTLGNNNLTMAEKLQESFERCCRLCAEEQDVTIMIFGEEAQAMLLQVKLKHYLLIGVEEEDKLPKNICISCCSKLHTVCDFIDSVRKAQSLLVNRFNEIGQISEQRVSSGMAIESEPTSDEEAKYSKMEVSVDPMMVLQNSEEEVCIAEKCQSKPEDVTSLQSADGEYVTIKLIKRSEEIAEQNETEAAEPNKIFKPFPCNICNRSFLSDLALKNHSWIHYKIDGIVCSDRYPCKQCDKSFDLKNDLFAHMKVHRTNCLCQFCGRAFRNTTNLEAHMALHYSMQRAYTCKICGRSYSTQSNLSVHSVTHSDNRPYSCHLCKKSFKRSQELKFHINQHTGAKPYKCPYCEKRFASSGNCYSHRNRMHPGMNAKVTKKNIREVVTPALTENKEQGRSPKNKITLNKGIYKFQCTICHHSFIRKDNFNYHMYQHTGEKPFRCSLCTAKFVSRKGLLIHHEKEHRHEQRPPALLSRNLYLK